MNGYLELNPQPKEAPRAAGHPPWLTENLVEATIRVWQPFYDQLLTRDDAIEMILCAGRLVGILARPRES